MLVKIKSPDCGNVEFEGEIVSEASVYEVIETSDDNTKICNAFVRSTLYRVSKDRSLFMEFDVIVESEYVFHGHSGLGDGEIFYDNVAAIDRYRNIRLDNTVKTLIQGMRR